MILDNIKNKYPKLPYILLSSIIFIFIAKSYAVSVFMINLDSNIPHGLNLFLIWGYRVCLILLLAFIKWNFSDIVLFILGLFLTYICKTTTFLSFITMGIFCKSNKISADYLVKNYFYITAIFFLGVILLNTFKIIPNSTEVHMRNNHIRNDLGLGNPNAPFLYSIPLYAGYIYLRFDKYDIIDRCILISVSLLVYSQTYSRTGLITIFAILAFVEIVKRVNIKKNKFAIFILSYLPILITGFTFLTALFLNNKFFNKLLSERPLLWNIYINHIKLFRNDYYFTLREMYPLDNAYLFALALYGIVFTVLLLLLYTFYMKENAIKANGKTLAVCSMFLIYAFGENMLFNAGLNFTLVLAISSLSSKNIFAFRRKIS